MEEGLTTTERPIDPQSLLNLLDASVIRQFTESYKSPPLPKNAVFYGVVDRHAQDLEQIVIIEREPCIRPYNHFGDIRSVGYPKLLFAYRIIGKTVTSTSVVAAVDEIMSDSSSIYHYPYANVSVGGVICWGSYRNPPITNLVDLTYLPEEFYLIEHTHEKNAHQEVVSDLLIKVENRAFDSGLLVFKETFENFINNNMNGR